MASTNSSATAKTHVSLRLPTYILESIDAHAEKESISRTEAFVFYLQTGLDIADTKANEPSKDESMLQNIQEELAEIKALLQSQQGLSVQEQAHEDFAISSRDEAEIAQAQQEAEEDFSTSDAMVEMTLESEESEPEAFESEDAEREDEFTTSDAVADPLASIYAGSETEAFTEIKPLDDASDFTTSDAVYDAHEVEDESDLEEDEEFDEADAPFEDTGDSADEIAYDLEDESEDEAESELDSEELFSDSDAVFEDEETDEALSYKKLEKAVSKASKQADLIEKVWIFGAAANEDAISDPSIDLCVKTEDDKKLKSKHLEPFIAAIEERTGKIVNVVLRHEVEDKSALQNRIELYKK